jgi:hypothetical protein
MFAVTKCTALKIDSNNSEATPTFYDGIKNWLKFTKLSGFTGDETDGKFQGVDCRMIHTSEIVPIIKDKMCDYCFREWNITP